MLSAGTQTMESAEDKHTARTAQSGQSSCQRIVYPLCTEQQTLRGAHDTHSVDTMSNICKTPLSDPLCEVDRRQTR